jgi:hypothetical protein
VGGHHPCLCRGPPPLGARPRRLTPAPQGRLPTRQPPRPPWGVASRGHCVRAPCLGPIRPVGASGVPPASRGSARGTARQRRGRRTGQRRGGNGVTAGLPPPHAGLPGAVRSVRGTSPQHPRWGARRSAVRKEGALGQDPLPFSATTGQSMAPPLPSDGHCVPPHLGPGPTQTLTDLLGQAGTLLTGRHWPPRSCGAIPSAAPATPSVARSAGGWGCPRTRKGRQGNMADDPYDAHGQFFALR